MLKILGVLILMFSSSQSVAIQKEMPTFEFNSIDGGKITLDQFLGNPVLISNTASKCGFTGQYKGLQRLYDKYKDKGLVVLGIPSANFRQEFKKNTEVKEFCEVNFSINFPMTEITNVIGKEAHPFYQWLEITHNYKPRWNFSKVLLGSDGNVLETFGTTVKPTSKLIETSILAVLEK